MNKHTQTTPATEILADFTSLNLVEPLMQAVTESGYTKPTPIQAQSIPILLEGHDLLGLAQTGTGKTAAFTLPMLQRLMAHRKQPQPKSMRALIDHAFNALIMRYDFLAHTLPDNLVT